jgi:hypothetical protein|tara:strand:+ start:1523 stop:1720 length:198 start_codon:yes stop_codon:yes gene_type:complete
MQAIILKLFKPYFKIGLRLMVEHRIPWNLDKNGLSIKSNQFILPYGIWITEVMLQQNQLTVVLPY